MRDTDIRHKLHRVLDLKYGSEPGTLIRHELGVCAGRRRVDVALINGELAGYEIKSDEDTLTRLAGQADDYARVLDRASIVTTERHLDAATSRLPIWWGVIVASSLEGQVHLDTFRPALLNCNHDAFSVAQLLWREEALDELKSRGLAGGFAKKARHYVWQALAEALELSELRFVVRTRLKERREWPGGQRHGRYGEMPPRLATP